MQNVKGTYDYFGKEQNLRKQVQSILQETFEVYDFDAMETTVLNELELLASKYAGGDEIIKEMYRLTDQGKRAIGLRYECTRYSTHRVHSHRAWAGEGDMTL